MIYSLLLLVLFVPPPPPLTFTLEHEFQVSKLQLSFISMPLCLAQYLALRTCSVNASQRNGFSSTQASTLQPPLSLHRHLDHRLQSYQEQLPPIEDACWKAGQRWCGPPEPLLWSLALWEALSPGGFNERDLPVLPTPHPQCLGRPLELSEGMENPRQGSGLPASTWGSWSL